MRRHWYLLLVLTLLLVVPAVIRAQDATPASEPLQVGTAGLLAEDGSVLYSVHLGSASDGTLSELTLTSTLPEGAQFEQALWTPEAAVFVGAKDGVVTWSLAELPADTILGPFTYRVTFAETESIPANVAATVTWDDGEASARLDEGELPEYEDSGSLTVEAAGTDGLAAVGNTGVYLLVPPGAYDHPVTFSFERLPLDQESDLPQAEENVSVWWCTLFRVTVEPAGVEASLPVTIVLPTIRTLTPGMEVIHFIRPPNGEWAIWESEQAGLVTPSGNYVSYVLLWAAPGAEFTLTAGVPTQLRSAAMVPNASSLKTPGWVEPDPQPWVEPDTQP